MQTMTEELKENTYKDENENLIEYFVDTVAFQKSDKEFYTYLPDPDFLNSGRYTPPKGHEGFDINKFIASGDVDKIEEYLTAVMKDSSMKEQLERIYKAQADITTIVLVRDSNNNKIVVSIDSHEFCTVPDAIQKLQTLKECTNCINSTDSIDAHNCISCHKVYKASNCIGVNDSINIENISFIDTVVDNEIDLSVNYEEDDIEDLAKDMFPRYFS
ncbi:hypothetical protein GJV85_02605 [Sulfurimonas aquatica]|uniref:Uncharacterized protein n=1 Tax=Sulfurimonas aquatica TaxID=2672570 RepID=A0A975AYX0_9BACT|nr:hypothetical protein [Sulfurimonas aquatica]QSZ41050.1 hypothetical protein GJV85_02605 [Sulfurimonas aquatica]